MDETTLTRAVEPFFTTKGVGKGTGLGLSTVHGIAVQSGGAMRIRSRSGHGTTVELWLPRSAEQPLQEATGPRQALARGDATVLVCEDYETVREFTREALQDAGFKVVVTENGPAALAALDDEHGSVDLLVVDFAMPGMNGVEVTRRARQCRPELPILLITGNANLGAVSDEAKGIPLLTKPFKQMQIVSAVAGLLESAAAG
jgi:CheY-like chemotaxis protein